MSTEPAARNAAERAPALVDAGMTIAVALAKVSPGLPPLEARILMGHALAMSKVQLITRDHLVLDAGQAALINDLFKRRMAGEPVAYLTGEREFFGLSFEVGPDVLIPRPETELLVELAIERLPAGASALDLGTGSGAIAITMARARPDARIEAIDVSAAALALARRNARRHEVAVNFVQSNWYQAVEGRRFDLLVSNPPYIVAGDRHLREGDLRFEPVDALTDHADGLSALRILAAGASRHLHSGGWLLMEHGFDQAGAVRTLLSSYGMQDVQSWYDLAGIARVSGGRL
ncbi:MAG: peptide chain release factor N(5)-glutamine methyltransferase [Janthinobacterium lividum]